MAKLYSVELKDSQIAFVRQMQEKYNLPDEAKTIRCLIDYAMEKKEEADEIFQKIRCTDC